MVDNMVGQQRARTGLPIPNVQQADGRLQAVCITLCLM